MKLIYVILFAILIAVLFISIVVLCLKTLEQKQKAWVIILAILSLVVTDSLFIATHSLPEKVDHLIAVELDNVESMLNNTQPGLTDQVMDPSSLQTTLADSKQLLSHANTDTSVGWIVRLIGARKYTKALEKIVCNTDDFIAAFQATGQPVTIHNVLTYTQEQMDSPILNAVRTLQIVILILSGVLFIICIICYFIVRSGAMNDAQIVIANN